MRLVIFGGCMVLLSLFSFVLGSVFLHGKDAAVKPKVTQTVEAVAESVSAEFPDTLQEILLLTHQDENKKRKIERQKICETVESDFFCGSLSDDKTNVLLTGDSFGLDGVNAMVAGYPDVNLILDVHGGCPLVPDVTQVSHARKACPELNVERYEAAEKILPKVDAVVISIKTTRERIPGAQDTVTWFADRGARVIVLGNPPMFRGRKLPEVIREHGRLAGLNEYASKWLANAGAVEDEMEAYVVAQGAEYFRRRDHICPGGGVCQILVDGIYPITMDNAHQSYAAAADFGEHLAEIRPDLFATE